MDLKGFLMIFLIVIVGLSLLSVIADKTYEATNMPYDTVNNETKDLSACLGCGGIMCTGITTECNQTLSRNNYASLTSVMADNGTTLTQDTDYKLDVTDDDAVRIDYLYTLNSAAIVSQNNNSYVIYDRYQDNYVRGSGASRTILGLNSLWFAIFIGLVVMGGVMAYMKKEGLL